MAINLSLKNPKVQFQSGGQQLKGTFNARKIFTGKRHCKRRAVIDNNLTVPVEDLASRSRQSDRTDLVLFSLFLVVLTFEDL